MKNTESMQSKRHEKNTRTRGLDARSSALATNPSWNSNELL